MKLLVAVDDSECSKRMLAWLMSQELWSGGGHDWTVFHGVAPLPHRAAALADPLTIENYYASDAERVLRPVRVFLQRHGIEAVYWHKVGPPAREIVRLARAGRFDLVVMGSHGRSGLAGAVLGSVVQRVVALGKQPVLVVR